MENFEYLPNDGSNQTPTDKSATELSNQTSPIKGGVSSVNIPKPRELPTVSAVPTTIAGSVSRVGLSGNNTTAYKSTPNNGGIYDNNSSYYNSNGNTKEQEIPIGSGSSSPSTQGIDGEALSEFALNRATAYSGGYITGANSETTVDVDKYKKYIRGSQVVSGSIDDLNRRRADDQSVFAQAGNATLRVVANVLPEIGQQVGGLFTNWGEADKEHANSVVEAMATIKQDVNEALPIYRKNPGKSFDMTDTAWWFDNGSNVITSGLAFAAIGYATGGLLNAGLTAGARGVLSGVNATRAAVGIDAVAQAATLSPRATNVINGLSTLGNSILMNQMETTGIQGQTFKDSYDKELTRLKRLPENFNVDDKILENRAKRVASDASVTAGLINRINILTNLTSLSKLGNPNLMTTRRLLTEPTLKKSLQSYGLEMGQEALEETINGLAQTIAVDKLDNSKDILNAALTAESLEQAFFGAFGGGFQTGVTSVINRLPTQTNKRYNDAYVNKLTELQKSNPNLTKEELNLKATEHAISVAGKKRISKKNLEKLDYETQQRAIEDIKNRLAPDQVRQLSSLFMTSDERKDLYNQIDSLEKEGKSAAADALKEKNMTSTIIQSFENGTTQVLEDNINAILEMSQEDAVKQGIATSLEDTSYKTKIAESLKDLKSLEKAYNRSYGLLDMGEIFNTEVQLHEYKKIFNNTRETLRTSLNLSEDSTIIDDYLRDGKLPNILNDVQGDSTLMSREEYKRNHAVTDGIKNTFNKDTSPEAQGIRDSASNREASLSYYKNTHKNILGEIESLEDYLTLLKSKEYQSKLKKSLNEHLDTKDKEEGKDDTIKNDVDDTVKPETEEEEITDDTEKGKKDEKIKEEKKGKVDTIPYTEEDYNKDIVTSLSNLDSLGVDSDILSMLDELVKTNDVVQIRNVFRDLAKKETNKDLKKEYTNISSKIVKYTATLLNSKSLTKEQAEITLIENQAIKNILNDIVTTLPTTSIRFHKTGYTDSKGVYVDLSPLNKAVNTPNFVENMMSAIKSKPYEDIVSEILKQVNEYLSSEAVQEAIDNDASDIVDDLIVSRDLVNNLIKEYQIFLEANKATLFNKPLDKQRKVETTKRRNNDILNEKETTLEELKEHQLKEEEQFIKVEETKLADAIKSIESSQSPDEQKQEYIQQAQEKYEQILDEYAKKQRKEFDDLVAVLEDDRKQFLEESDVESENYVPFENLYESLPIESKSLIDDSRSNIEAIFRKLKERGVDTQDYNSLVGAIQAITGQEIIGKTLDIITFFYNEANNSNITRPLINGLDTVYTTFIDDLLTNIEESSDFIDEWSAQDNTNTVDIIGKMINPLRLTDQVMYGNEGATKSVTADKIAYLAKEYISYTKDGKYTRADLSGEVRVDEVDIRLLSNKEGLQEGAVIELRPMTEDEYKAEQGDSYKDDYVNDAGNIPIAMYVNGTRLKGAFLHTVNWIHPKNVRGDEEFLASEKSNLLNLRKEVLTNGSLSVQLVGVTKGVINTSNEYSPIGEVADTLDIVVVRNGKAFSTIETASDVIVDRDIKNGTVGILVPMKDGFDILPTVKSPLSPEYLTSIYHIVDTFLFQDDREAFDPTIKKELELRGLNFNSFASLRNFLNPIINVNTARHLNSDQYKTKYLNKKDKISSIKISNNSIEFTYNGEYFFLSRAVAKDNPLVVKNILDNQFKDMLTTMYHNTDINSLGKTIEFPLFSAKGELVGEINDYTSYIKEVSLTNLAPIELPNGETIYNIQKSYILDYSNVTIPIDKNLGTEIDTDDNNGDGMNTDIYGNVQDNQRGIEDGAFDDFGDLSPEVVEANSNLTEEEIISNEETKVTISETFIKEIKEAVGEENSTEEEVVEEILQSIRTNTDSTKFKSNKFKSLVDIIRNFLASLIIVFSPISNVNATSTIKQDLSTSIVNTIQAPTVEKGVESVFVTKAITYLGNKEIKGDKEYGSENLGFVDKDFDSLMRSNGFENGYAWCAIYVKSVLSTLDDSSAKEANKILTAGVLNSYEAIKDANSSAIKTINESDIKEGDLIFYNSGKGNGHIAIVVSINSDGTYNTIEGNTNDNGDREGYEVTNRVRTLHGEENYKFAGAARIDFKTVNKDKGNDLIKSTVGVSVPNNINLNKIKETITFSVNSRTLDRFKGLDNSINKSINNILVNSPDKTTYEVMQTLADNNIIRRICD